MTKWTIGRVAAAAGVGVETVRFYERRGLIERPPRPADGGARDYPEATVARLRFIRQAQRLGFSLSEAAELLALRVHAADAGAIRERAAAKLADVDDRIARLAAMREALAALVDSCPGRGALNGCSILDALDRGSGDSP